MSLLCRVVAIAALGLCTVAGCNVILGIDPPRSEGMAADAASDADARVGAGPPGAADAGGCDATICDDFAPRAAPVPPGDPRWLKADCSGGTLVVDGGLVVAAPPVPAGAIGRCALVSKSSNEIRSSLSAVERATIDFEVALDTADTAFGPVLMELDVQSPGNAIQPDGFDGELVQLEAHTDGGAALLAVFHDPSSPENPYPVFQLAGMFDPKTPFLRLGTKCHVRIEVSFSTLEGSATSACGDQTVAMVAMPGAKPAGFRGPVTLSLGFLKTTDPASPAFTATYRSVALQLDP